MVRVDVCRANKCMGDLDYVAGILLSLFEPDVIGADIK